MTDRMIAEAKGAIGWITFNNPARRNAVSLDMWEAIPGIVDRFEADPAVRAIVLKGAGEEAFVSGADISEFEQKRADPERIKHYDGTSERAMKRLGEARKPTIAMIRGWCIGGGVAVAITCDLRIAATGARFGVPAARLGLGYSWPGVKKLMDLVGPSTVKEIFFTARHFTAAEAYDRRLVDEIVPDAELESRVEKIAGMIADNAPITVASIKQIVHELSKPPETFDRAKCDRLTAECFASEDYVEGRRAFLEKRRPAFKGR